MVSGKIRKRRAKRQNLFERVSGDSVSCDGGDGEIVGCEQEGEC